MEEAQNLIEQWLTECRSRDLYEASDINARLNELTELITDPDAQNILVAWKEAVSLDEYHSANKVSDNLLDMYGPVLRYNQALQDLANGLNQVVIQA